MPHIWIQARSTCIPYIWCLRCCHIYIWYFLICVLFQVPMDSTCRHYLLHMVLSCLCPITEFRLEVSIYAPYHKTIVMDYICPISEWCFCFNHLLNMVLTCLCPMSEFKLGVFIYAPYLGTMIMDYKCPISEK